MLGCHGQKHLFFFAPGVWCFFHRRGQDFLGKVIRIWVVCARSRFFSSKAYFNGVEGNPETWCFIFNPGNFCGGLVAIGEKNQLDEWPKRVGWGLAVCEIVPVVFRDNSFWLRHFEYHFSGDDILCFIVNMTVKVDILRKVSLHLDVPGS